MSLSVIVSDGFMQIISANNRVLRFPDPREFHQWGSNQVTLDGKQIPSARIWDYLAKCKQKEEQFSYDKLMNEAERAEIYSQLDTGMIVYTLFPKKDDRLISGNVYARKEKQRIRYLANKFLVVIGKFEEPVTPEVIKEMNAACAGIKYYPVGCVDDRIYYTKDPEAVFNTLDTKDVTKIGVFLKRPSSSSFVLNLS